ISGDGTADRWAAGSGGTLTTYLAALGTGTATLTAQPAQNLIPPAHAWELSDNTATVPIVAADSAGGLNATGGGNAAWNTGDLFDPYGLLDGSNFTKLATTIPAIYPAP